MSVVRGNSLLISFSKILSKCLRKDIRMVLFSSKSGQSAVTSFPFSFFFSSCQSKSVVQWRSVDE